MSSGVAVLALTVAGELRYYVCSLLAAPWKVAQNFSKVMKEAYTKPPPYMSYLTLRKFLDGIAATALPSQIDGSLLASKSGSSKKLLRSTLRSLGLTNDQGVPTPDMQRLVKAKGAEREQIWRLILRRSYPKLFDGNIDLARTTTKELSDVFEDLGVASQDTIRKCVTFFSLAAKDAGIKLSPHVKPYSGTRPPRVNLGNGYRTVDSVSSHDSTSQRFRALLEKFPAFDPSWSEEKRNGWVQAFKELEETGYLRAKGLSSDE
jgi:hypothetical protein